MILVVLILTLLLLTALYLFVFIRPRATRPYNKQLLCDYAHRGLHDESHPENSIIAFNRACENGVGIELDVQLSKDKEVMVFHDYTLERMTGVKNKLDHLDAIELTNLSLKNSSQTIPTLKQVLNLVHGKVPLLIELKGENLDSSLCPKVAELLKDYKGAYCIESFNPFLIKSMRKYLPNAYYGQLYTNVCRDKKKYTLLNILLTGMAFNFISNPNFIAYNELDRDSVFVKITTKFYKAKKFVWTVKNKNDIDSAKLYGENAIFEDI